MLSLTSPPPRLAQSQIIAEWLDGHLPEDENGYAQNEATFILVGLQTAAVSACGRSARSIDAYHAHVRCIYDSLQRKSTMVGEEHLELLHIVGKGAFGEVWLGRQTVEEAPGVSVLVDVAVKRMRDGQDKDPVALKSFSDEAELMFKTDHQFIAQFYGRTTIRGELLFDPLPW